MPGPMPGRRQTRAKPTEGKFHRRRTGRHLQRVAPFFFALIGRRPLCRPTPGGNHPSLGRKSREGVRTQFEGMAPSKVRPIAAEEIPWQLQSRWNGWAVGSR
jgi:hypothetical protein